MNPLNHVAIIMDGNGRWGLKYKNSRNAGHKEGINTIEKIIKETIKNKIKYLTLFAFSTENWKRPDKEIKYLFNLLETFLEKKIEDFHHQEIKLKIIGAEPYVGTIFQSQLYLSDEFLHNEKFGGLYFAKTLACLIF